MIPWNGRNPFFLFEKKHLRKTGGYYIFYEKNQEMQNYMLRKKGTMPSEEVDDYVIKEMKKRMEGMGEKRRRKDKAKKKIKLATILGMAILLGVIWQKRDMIKGWNPAIETLSDKKNMNNNNKEKDELLIETAGSRDCYFRRGNRQLGERTIRRKRGQA